VGRVLVGEGVTIGGNDSGRSEGAEGRLRCRRQSYKANKQPWVARVTPLLLHYHCFCDNFRATGLIPLAMLDLLFLMHSHDRSHSHWYNGATKPPVIGRWLGLEARGHMLHEPAQRNAGRTKLIEYRDSLRFPWSPRTVVHSSCMATIRWFQEKAHKVANSVSLKVRLLLSQWCERHLWYPCFPQYHGCMELCSCCTLLHRNEHKHRTRSATSIARRVNPLGLYPSRRILSSLRIRKPYISYGLREVHLQMHIGLFAGHHSSSSHRMNPVMTPPKTPPNRKKVTNTLDPMASSEILRALWNEGLEWWDNPCSHSIRRMRGNEGQGGDERLGDLQDVRLVMMWS